MGVAFRQNSRHARAKPFPRELLAAADEVIE
jgi:hypothetical protein